MVLLGNAVHGVAELFENYQAITICVNLLKNFIPELLILLLSCFKDRPQLRPRYLSVVILVKHVESKSQIIFDKQLLFVCGGCQELCVINFSVEVLVQSFQYVFKNL